VSHCRTGHLVRPTLFRVAMPVTVAVTLVATLAVALVAGCGTPSPPTARTGMLTAPPMGWNSWDSGVDLTEHNVESQIDAMIASGMRDAGYRYINLDAGWAQPVRDAQGHLQTDPTKFPGGIAAVAAYAHARGMRFGLYASPYDEKCSAEPALASVGHEDTDAKDFADWGVDFLKYDWCRTKVDHDTQVAVFTRMGQALHATGRPIVYSINPDSDGDRTAGARYDWSGIADMARTGADLVPVWRKSTPPIGPLDEFTRKSYLGVPAAFDGASHTVRPSRPGFWSDPDMLVVGLGWDQFVTAHFVKIRSSLTVGDVAPDQQAALAQVAALSDEQLMTRLVQQPGLTDVEQRAHMSLWAMLSAPLLAGNDLRTMSPPTRDMLTNRDVIAVDQDPAAAPAKPSGDDARILVKPLSDGAVAVAYVNSADAPATMGSTAAAAGLAKASCYTVRDLWTHAETTIAAHLADVAVPAHGVTLLRVTPNCR
jgi:alpha-galactosidase